MNLLEKFINSYPPPLLLKANENIRKIGKKTNNETKIIIEPILPTIKLSPFSHPRAANPWVI